MVERFRPQFENAQCQISLTDEGSLIGIWDRFRIEQVIANLFTNAIRYGAGHPVTITLYPEGKMAVLQVKDQGIGIAQEDQQRIFLRFERAVSASEISGLGLGLYIVRQILEMHGGTISVQSNIGKGSEFTVKLPLSELP
jgi:signal transduction histidine kinase